MVNIMVKITLNDNLVPCEREPWALGRPAHDLTNNIVAAERFASIAIRFFGLRRGSVRFSGFVSPGNQGLHIKVWEGERIYRSVKFRNHKYSGVLHVLPKEGLIQHCLGQDLIGDSDANECVAGYA